MSKEKFKVKALSVGGGNKIYHSGDTVTAECFPKQNINTLLVQGFLEKIETKVEAEIKEPSKSSLNIDERIDKINSCETIEYLNILADGEKSKRVKKAIALKRIELGV